MATWVLVANSSFAEIYNLDKKDLNLVQLMDFPDGRLKSGEILQDRPGRGFEGKSRTGAGFGRHAYSNSVDPHMHEQQIFAHHIADILRHSKGTNSFNKLIIIAPPQFLGLLRDALPDAVRLSINKEIAKDISSDIQGQERLELVRKFLDLKKAAASPRS